MSGKLIDNLLGQCNPLFLKIEDTFASFQIGVYLCQGIFDTLVAGWGQILYERSAGLWA